MSKSGSIPDDVLRILVLKVQSRDPDAEQELYDRIIRNIRRCVGRRIPYDFVEDVVQSVLLTTYEEIRNGNLHVPSAVFGYVRTITNRKIAAHIERLIIERKARASQHPISFSQRESVKETFTTEKYDHSASDMTPEEQFYQKERLAAVKLALANMRPIDKEILHRFYLLEQSEAEIREAMDLTDNQFRNLKSRALDKVTVLIKRQQQMQRVQRQVTSVRAA